jgi:hypothetical protein
LVPESVHLVTEQNANRKVGLPIKQIDSVDAGFDRSDLVIVQPELLNEQARIRGVLPWDSLFGAERGFADGPFGRTSSDAAQVEFLAACGVRSAEERAHVVHAADIVE